MIYYYFPFLNIFLQFIHILLSHTSLSFVALKSVKNESIFNSKHKNENAFIVKYYRFMNYRRL